MGDELEQAPRSSPPGDAEAAHDLMPMVYDELRRMAAMQLRGQADGHTLQPTALVHEAFMKLVRQDPSWTDRVHFCSLAARAMRHILIDHARRKQAAKRGGKQQARVTLTGLAGSDPSLVDVMALEAALERLEALDERQARIVELRVFGGLQVKEVAEVIGVTARTIRTEWRRVKAWLSSELGLHQPA